jgi:hypothetical protein
MKRIRGGGGRSGQIGLPIAGYPDMVASGIKEGRFPGGIPKP